MSDQGGYVVITFRDGVPAEAEQAEVDRIHGLRDVAAVVHAHNERFVQYNVYPMGEELPDFARLQRLQARIGGRRPGPDSPLLAVDVKAAQP
jgi:hypothetical protein